MRMTIHLHSYHAYTSTKAAQFQMYLTISICPVFRYKDLIDPSGFQRPCHYLTHYSNAAIVLHYLLRIEPFTSLHVKLQGGRFDCSDRQFYSIPKSWKGLLNGAGDVRELIPEFFCFPDFLTNINKFDLGCLQVGLFIGKMP